MLASLSPLERAPPRSSFAARQVNLGEPTSDDPPGDLADLR
jgi:hypothetical protein